MPPRRRVIQENNIEEDKKKDFEGYTNDFDKFQDNPIYLVIYGEIKEARPAQVEAFKNLQTAENLLDVSEDDAEGNRLLKLANEEGMSVDDEDYVIYTDTQNDKFLVLAKSPPPTTHSVRRTASSSIIHNEIVSSESKTNKRNIAPLTVEEEVLTPIPRRRELVRATEETSPSRRTREESRSRFFGTESPIVSASPEPRSRNIQETLTRMITSPSRRGVRVEEKKEEVPPLRRRGDFRENLEVSPVPRRREPTKAEEIKIENPIKYPKTDTVSRRSFLFDTLISIYNKDKQPPFEGRDSWAKDAYVFDYEFYAPKARVYTTSKDIDIVTRLVTEREPVNMYATKHYNTSRMLEIFGYNDSYYDRYYNQHKTIPPNIGVYTLAPTRLGDKIVDLHYYHAIGIALDSAKQSDYKYYNGKSDNLLIDAYINIFSGIFECALDLKMEHIIMSIVGGGFFADLYKGGKSEFQKNVWVTAFVRAYGKYKDKLKNVKLSIMGASGQVAGIYFKDSGRDNFGYFPNFINDGIDFNKTLFVNAWDSNSLPGNGNKGDDSLDGFIGRISAIQFIGCGLTNSYLRNNIRVF